MTRGQVMRIGLRVVLPVICVIVLGAISGIGQEPTVEITGIVTDATGASVPAARIQVITLSTGVHWETESNKSGNYVFSNLPPADYRINVQKQGFSTVPTVNPVWAGGQHPYTCESDARCTLRQNYVGACAREIHAPICDQRP